MNRLTLPPTLFIKRVRDRIIEWPLPLAMSST